ncbi:capsular polysaccharide biosynthesis protein [Ideonella sp.]|uniref:capsular polysaccharide biosynthesis protein n=1 Tax=Ideonella sp. TaxID=1929293 RepID=UPI0035B060A4
MAVVHGPGLLAHTPTLPALLPELSLVGPRKAADARPDGVLVWGRKPSAKRAEAWAHERRLPLIRLEDGFLRSVGLGADEPPLSVVIDPLGIYYDAGGPSRLEQLIATPLTAPQQARASALATRWREARVSKYNQAREAPGLVRDGDVLVIDQTFGDASIAYGGATPASFTRMLEAALDEHPGARVLLKVHPDVVAGRKRGHFAQLSPGAAARVQLLASPAHPCGLLERAGAVYTVTSQMGFEALLWGLPLRCFGMPFYAGWGLTRDELSPPERRGAASLAALSHAALIDYPRYLDPETGQRCEPERLLDWMALQRRMRERFPAQMVAVGFSRWKKPIARAFFAGSDLRFQSAHRPVPAGAGLALWGRRPVPPAAAGEGAPPLVVRLEDGFLRSVGLGADLVRPLSWVMDRQGMYYDATAPSALERLLAETVFDDTLCERARALRERILAAGLTKYNVGQARWPRPATAKPVVLVVGQVEGDASIRLGAPGLRTNMALLKAVRAERPDAHLVYKPHPDVVAQLREAGCGEGAAAALCDEIVVDAPMDQVLRQVDEVHVLTSLAGFEALLRGKPVVCWGCPFYAGWGLTQDREPIARRTRRLSLDALVAGALLLYPSYVSRVTGHFTTAERALSELQSWRDEGAAGRRPVSAGRRAWRWTLRHVVALRRWWSGEAA